jgi:hypothetical protein
MWAQARYATNFFLNNAIPFQNMTNENVRLLSNKPVEQTDDFSDDDNSNDDDAVRDQVNWCLVGAKDIVVYLPFGGTDFIDVNGWVKTGVSGNVTALSIHWYNPREGGILQIGTIQSVQVPGGSTTLPVPLGAAPSREDKDWVVLLRHVNAV